MGTQSQNSSEPPLLERTRRLEAVKMTMPLLARANLDGVDCANLEDDSGEPCIYVVDDHQMVREALGGLFRSVGYRVQLFDSGTDFMEAGFPDACCCLVLDIRLPGISGLELQTHLKRKQIHIPIVFMTGHGDVPMSVGAMKAGAIDFLAKPFRDQDMLDAVARALDTDRKHREAEQPVSRLRTAFQSLTARERDVMKLVTTGLMNKQIAGMMKLSEITVKIHRGNVMRKMAARSLADLVRMVDLLSLGSTKL
ncbi:response regulator transcription factor [Hypericibacter sp.]|uniref:response regulator transcription factor n=1 Tax=Hypericibacter sp. TaxID=2705401 RepID=UPI003D6CE3DD